MKDILDEPFEEEIKKENHYTQKAYKAFKRASNLIIGSIIIAIIAEFFNVSEFVFYFCIGGIVFALLSGTLGIADSYRSYIYKEENTIEKWLAITGNSFLSLMLLAPFIAVIVLALYNDNLPLSAKVFLISLFIGFIALVIFIFYIISKNDKNE